MPRDEPEEFESIASHADAVLHPIRLRILNALSPRRQMTPPQLCALLSDVPESSLYRHLRILVEAEAVKVIETANARGTTEKYYTLPEQEMVFHLADARPDDLVRYFTTFVSALMSQGRAFFGQADAAKRRGGTYSANALYLTDQEYEHFCAALEGLTNLAQSNPPGPGRRRRLCYTAILPEEERVGSRD